MSWDLYVVDPNTKETLHSKIKHELQGGTFTVGGTDELWLNITYNYGKWFYKAFEGTETYRISREKDCSVIYALDGRRVCETLCDIEKAINSLSYDGAGEDYWEPTEGNAKRALQKLYALGHFRPDGEWKVC